MNHLEIEFKTGLSQESYSSLLTEFREAEQLDQVNYYFDTADQCMKKAKMALRIRTEGDRRELTLKIPQSVGNMEYNQDLTEEEMTLFLNKGVFPAGQVQDILLEKRLAVAELVLLGTLENHRLEMETSIGLMALDQSRYFGVTDYELELEVIDPILGQKNFQDFLAARGIPYQEVASKIARFAQARKNTEI